LEGVELGCVELDWLTLAWLELAWLDFAEPFCFVCPGAFADLPCEVELALASALASTLALALAFAAGCAGWPACFCWPGALPELPGEAGGPCPLPAIAVPARAARTSARPSAIAALRRFIFASPLLRTTAYVEGHVDLTGLSPMDPH
jgi:hypothetical protein